MTHRVDELLVDIQTLLTTTGNTYTTPGVLYRNGKYVAVLLEVGTYDDYVVNSEEVGNSPEGALVALMRPLQDQLKSVIAQKEEELVRLKRLTGQ